MKYYNYIDIPNWKDLQSQLIVHCHKTLYRTEIDLQNNIDLKWHCHFPDQVKNELPDVYTTFEKMGLHIKQMIYFINMHNDLTITDSNDPRSIFIHTQVIGIETKEQILAQTGRLPDAVVACIGGGSNAMGIFYPFIEESQVQLHGFEAAGDGIETGRHAATLTGGAIGILHGTRSYVLQDKDGQTLASHSISAGLDYPGVGPEHAWLKDSKRASYHPITDAEAMEGFALLSKLEGIIPAIETAHAVAGVVKIAKDFDKEDIIVLNCSGRGDKDVETAAKWFGFKV